MSEPTEDIQDQEIEDALDVLTDASVEASEDSIDLEGDDVEATADESSDSHAVTDNAEVADEGFLPPDQEDEGDLLNATEDVVELETETTAPLDPPTPSSVPEEEAETPASRQRALIQYLLELAKQGFTGTLQARTLSREHDCFLVFREGHIVDVIPIEAPSFLERALCSESSPLADKDRRRIAKQALQKRSDPGRLIIEQALLSAEDVSRLVLEEVESMVGNLIADDQTHADPIDRRATTVPNRGMAEVLQLSVHPEHAILGGARRLGRWGLVREGLPALKDVYYATPSAFGLLDAAAELPIEVALIEGMDGRNDLLQVIENTQEDPFVCLERIHVLHHAGHIALINPVQMFQLGCEVEREGELERALRLFERAEDRGLDDFDLGYKLGETYHALGRRKEAIERFLAFAEKCVVQFRIDDTIRSCKKIIEIDPGNLQIQERYISLLARYGKGEEAVSEGLALARRLEGSGEEDRARATLEKIFELAEANEEVLRLYTHLCDKTGNSENASNARHQLAKLFHEREESEKALELYQGLFVRGDDSDEVRARLVELHFRAGNSDKALEHLDALSGRRGWSPRNACPEAAQLYRHLHELEFTDPRITEWLIQESRMRGDREMQTELLKQYRDQLETTGELDQARKAAERLYRLNPSSIIDARTLASLEHRCGRSHRAALVLEELAQRLTRSKEHQSLVPEIIQELLEVAPLSLTARHLQLLRVDPETNPDLHRRILIESTLLELVSGNCTAAEQLFSELQEDWIPPEHNRRRAADGGGDPKPHSLTPFFSYLFAHETRWHGDVDKSMEWLLQGARQAKKTGDRGLLQQFIREIKSNNPDHAEIEELQQAAQRMHTPEPTRKAPVKKSSVSGNLQRLKGLKDGGTPSGKTAKVKISSSVDKLKGLKPGASLSDATDSDPAAADPSADIVSTTGGSDAPGGNASGGAASGDDALAPLPKPKKGKLGAVARLKALKDGDSAKAVSAADEPTDDMTDAANDLIQQEVMKVNNPTPKNKKMGGAASKLSALRGKS